MSQIMAILLECQKDNNVWVIGETQRRYSGKSIDGKNTLLAGRMEIGKMFPFCQTLWLCVISNGR